jgi:hypothetical protein
MLDVMRACVCAVMYSFWIYFEKEQGNDNGDGDFRVGQKTETPRNGSLPGDVPNVQEIGVARGGHFEALLARGTI